MQSYVIGIDIGGTNFRIGLVSKDGELLHFQRRSSQTLATDDAVDTMAQQIEAYLQQFDVKDAVKAVAIGFPSTVSKDKTTLLSTPNLTGFDGVNIAQPLEARLGIPVYIDRDVNFLLQNDIIQLGLKKEQTILGFYIGTGFGNAIYINGEFYGGKNGAAGELGHIPLYDVEDLCTCGNRGCVETRCSGKYLKTLVERHFPGTAIDDVFVKHGDDPRLIKYVRDLAIPVAVEINIMDPHISILAGGVLTMKDFPKDLFEQAIRERVRKPYPAQGLELLYAQHAPHSGVMGSGYFAHQQLLR